MFESFFVKLAGKKIAKELDLQEGTAMEVKKWWKSKGVWTGIVTVLIGTYEMVKINLAPQIGFQLPEIPPLLYTFLGALGIYSRVVAGSKIN